MIISQTPVRISFFGGGSDFPEHFQRFGGAVLSSTVDKFCYLTVGYLSDFFDYKIKVSYSRTELLRDISGLKHPAVKACLEHLNITSNIEINYFSDLPARTGLGTSSAFVVGLLNALYAYRQTRVSPSQLAEEAVYVERELVGENVGYQDQYAAAFGGFNWIEFRPAGEVHVQRLICPLPLLEELNRNLLLFYTGLQRYSDRIQKKHVSKIAANEHLLREMSDLAWRGRDILSRGNDPLSEFGRLLNRAWFLKKNLGTGVSSVPIDEMYEGALKAGALGGKLLGAGGGGFLLLYVEPPRQEKVREVLSSLLEVKFNFEKTGSQIIFYDPDKLGRPG